MKSQNYFSTWLGTTTTSYNSVIILIKLILKNKGSVQQIYYKAYLSNGKIITRPTTVVFYKKEDGINYCKQSNLPYSYE